MKVSILVAAAVVWLLPSSLYAQTVHDGDSIKFGNQMTRLFGIDAPELKQTCDGGTWAAGKLATEALIKMIDGQPLTCAVITRDTVYNRPVSRCFAGNVDLSREMVVQGWAWAFTRYSKMFVDDEKFAKTVKVGVHAHDCQLPWDWRKAQRVSP